MIFDIIVAILLIAPAIIGYRRGIIGSGIHSLGWVGAVVAGAVATNKLHDSIGEIFLYDKIADTLDMKFKSAPQSTADSLQSVPEFIRGGIVATSESAYQIVNSYLTEILVIVITFVAAVVIIKVVLSLIVTPIIRHYRRSVIGRLDRSCGAVLGLIEGLVLTFLVMALAVAVVSLGSPQTSSMIIAELDKSVVARTIYDNNILLLVTKGFFLN